MKKITQTALFLEFTSHFLGFAAVFSAVTVIFSSPSIRMSKEETARIADAQTAAAVPLPVIVIDPGHGGEDGGAVAADGTCEKDINLYIAKCVYGILTSAGFECTLTRSGDVMLSDAAGSTRKMRDLRQRVQATEGKDCIFVSIHQNKFPQQSCRGTQVYYSGNDPGSEALARTVADSVKKYLQPDNKREIKRAGAEIFVLDRCTVPAILIECGFLSNPEEFEKLKTEEYKKTLACTIAASVASYVTSETARTE